jgi:hypothetical protein
VATQHDIEIMITLYGDEADLYCLRPAISLGTIWLGDSDVAGE